MRKMRVLATVSAAALVTSLGATAARADNNLVVDLTVPSLTITAASSSEEVANAQLANSASDTASTTNTAIGFPGGDPTLFHDVAGGTDTIIVDNVNSIFAQAGSNEVVNDLDFSTATGSGDSSAATLGSLQGSDSSDVIATIDNSNVLAQVLDLGGGSTVRVNDNQIKADGTINTADNLVHGDINYGLTSTEVGQADIDAAAGTISAGATGLAGNVQTISGAGDTSAFISDSRIGLLAQTSVQPDISGAPLDVIGNSIAATFTGNDANTGVALTDGQAVSLPGTVGAVNAQSADGDYSFGATVDSVVIEAANTQDLGPDAYMADLSDSTLTLRDNEIRAQATSNKAGNSVSLADGVDLTGVASSRLNQFDAGADTASVNGDLFIANAQYSGVAVNAAVDEGEVNVLTGDAAGSTIIADSNTIGAGATGSSVDNALEVTGATDFSALVAINSVQYTEGTQAASNDSHIVLDTGTDPLASTLQSVDESSLSADGNSIYSEATGNSQSSTMDIAGTTVTGAGALIANPILVDRPSESGHVSADFSLLNAQVLDGGGAHADMVTQIDADAGADTFTTSGLSVSGNDIHGLAIGNLSTEASIAIDATTLTGTVGLANSQTVEDGASLSSNITTQGSAITEGNAFITADVGANPNSYVNDASVNVDDNTFDSRVWGNLADSTTNSIQISGETVDSGPHPLRSAASVSRPGGVTYAAVDHSIALLNDQSVEDLDASVVTASATGDLINLTVGQTGGLAILTDSAITASGNSATTSATLNQATSEVGVDAGSLDNAAALVNVQTLADQNNNGQSASIDVSQNDLDITVDARSGLEIDITNTTVKADDNSTLAAARVNQATNSIDVSAQTQTLTNTLDPALPTLAPITGTTSVALSSTGSYAMGETALVNDQSFARLGNDAGPVGGDGMSVYVFDNDITVDIGTGSSLRNVVAETSGNSITGLAAGNDATNTLNLDVGTFDMSKANQDTAGPANGPIASIASQQAGTAGDGSGSIAATVDGSTVAVDGSDSDTFAVIGSDLSADQNAVRALARTNNVSNALTASGTTVLNDTYETPDASISGGDGLVLLDQTSFAVASRQVSSVGDTATVSNTAISAQAGDPSLANPPAHQPIDAGIAGTSISANSNLVVAEARGNDAGNLLSTDFVDNAAQSTVANSQLTGGTGLVEEPVTYAASVDGAEISALADVGESVTDSAFTANGNAVAALASANRASNELDASGTNLTMRNGLNSTSWTSGLGGDVLDSDGALAVLNRQGNGGEILASPDRVIANVNDANIGVYSNGLFDSGSVSADDNLVLAQAVDQSASNTLNMTASANIASKGLDAQPGASVASVQSVAVGSQVNATILDSAVAGIVDDQRSTLSMAASASNNQFLASAIGGTVTNTLAAKAGADISGKTFQSPTISSNGIDPTMVNGGFNVLNLQGGGEVQFTSTIDGIDIAAGGAEDYNNDSAAVNNNVVQAEARAFVANNTLTLDAGSSSDTTAVIANGQFASALVQSSVNDVVIASGNLDEGAIDSSLTVDGNAVQALASGNQATNSLSTTAAASLQESDGAGAVLNGGGLFESTSVSGADYAVLNDQVTGGSLISASVTQTGIGIDGLEATTGVNTSALNVNGNQVNASAVGNDATNTLALNTGTYAHPSAALTNLQDNSGTSVSASVDGAAIGIGGVGTTISATSVNSSFTVQGNSIGASAIGNRAVNSLTSGMAN
ncbi:MAG: hypothetical protein GC201_13830 [Alphaproteobacteria bacterium]|nr:hypothetical protein [Alphaproteobacteria bacterium]